MLNELVKSRPDDPDVWYDMAEVRGLSGNTIGLHRARAEYFTLVGDFDQAIQQLDYAKRRRVGISRWPHRLTSASARSWSNGAWFRK